MKSTLLILTGVALALVACEKDRQDTGEVQVIWPDLPAQMYTYADPVLPAHFGVPLNFFESTPDDNPVTDAGATLGRVLFYDVNLSASRTISCGSCHHQEHGFADVTALSVGHQGGETRRNASHIVNLRYNRRLFWDLRAQGLEEQVLMPIQDAVEMGMTLGQLVERVEEMPYYDGLFEQAFGDDGVTTDRISRALSQFVRSILSYRTKYDAGVEQEFANYTPQELEGMELFFNGTTRCNQCHMTANFFTPQAFNDGLEVEYTDNGLGELTGEADDMGKFKVPSLRNVELTGPYMHDGRFATLEEVVEHYNSGLQAHPYIDDRLTEEVQIGGTPYQLNLTESQKAALVAFLKTLTDHELVNDVRFGDPFR